MTWVVDANVAVRWFVDLLDWQQARAIIESGQALLAPDLVIAEVSNTLWRYVRAGDYEFEHAVSAVAKLPSFFSEITSAAGLSESALRMAKNIDHSVYDCLYAALAVERRATLITADRRFAEKLRIGRYLSSVKLLDEIRL